MDKIEIISDKRFIECGGKLLAEIVAGSRLYGLETENSDTDWRGLFIATDPHYVAALRKIESIVQLEKETSRDAAYYELKHFLLMMAKTNTQVLEILFSPESSFVSTSATFDFMQVNREKLINTDLLKKSLYGYVVSELRLANGERVGQLGGKRKLQLEKYGFSPKNFVQIFRLIFVGKTFFTDNIFPVNLKQFNPDFCAELLDIKTNPQNYKREELDARVHKELDELNKIMDASDVKHEFDWDLAANIILNEYKQL